MIPIVCWCSLLFGSWPLRWDATNGRFTFSYRFVVTSALMFCINTFYLAKQSGVVGDRSGSASPQHLLLFTIHVTVTILIANRWSNAKQDEYFANELYAACARTVESSRCLPEFWCRVAIVCLTGCGLYHKYRKIMGATVVVQVVLAVTCIEFANTTAECVYATTCTALADEFAAINRRAEAFAVVASAADDEIRRLSGAHCRMARLVRLCNGRYGAAMFLTTLNLMLCQTYTLNNFVSVFVNGDRFDSRFATFSHFFDLYTWLSLWWRLWLACHRVHRLVAQVHATRTIMFAKDLNSYPEHTRRLALDFLDQLIHRNVRITAWGFYDLNMELLFSALGYQFGVCLVCTQFTTGVLFIENHDDAAATNATRPADSVP